MSRTASLELLHHKIFFSSILYHIAPKLPGSVAVVLVGDRVVVSPTVNISFKCSVAYIYIIRIDVHNYDDYNTFCEISH